MVQTLRIVPCSSHASAVSPAPGAPSAPGVHDTLRANLNLSAPAPKVTGPATLQSAHPLESRLSQWREQQDRLKMELLRRQFGMAEPVRRQMELRIVRGGEWRPGVLAGGFGGGASAGVHGEILSGRDCEVGWEDVFVGGELRDGVDFHTEMEARLKMAGW